MKPWAIITIVLSLMAVFCYLWVNSFILYYKRNFNYKLAKVREEVANSKKSMANYNRIRLLIVELYQMRGADTKEVDILRKEFLDKFFKQAKTIKDGK